MNSIRTQQDKHASQHGVKNNITSHVSHRIKYYC